MATCTKGGYDDSEAGVEVGKISHVDVHLVAMSERIAMTIFYDSVPESHPSRAVIGDHCAVRLVCTERRNDTGTAYSFWTLSD